MTIECAIPELLRIALTSVSLEMALNAFKMHYSIIIIHFIELGLAQKGL